MKHARVLGPIAKVAVATLMVVGVIGPGVPASAGSSYFIDVRGSRLRVDGTFTPVVGHFSSLLYDDIYWYSPTGGDRLWSGGRRGATPDDVFSKPALAIDQTAGYAATVGDFAGDAKDDILWRSATGPEVLWTTSGPHAFTATTLQDAPNTATTRSVVLADSDGGQGKDDVYWWSSSTTGALWIFPDNGSGSPASSPLTTPTAYSVVSGDFDGNGVSDLAFSGDGKVRTWRRSSGTATLFLKTSGSGSATLAGRFGPALDGRDDLAAIYRGQVAPCEGCVVALGAMEILQSTTSGTYTASDADQRTTSRFQYRVEGTSRDLILADYFGVRSHFEKPSSLRADTVWYQTSSGPVARPTGVADLVGDTPIIGRFSTASRQDVFDYVPGTSTDRLLVIR